MNDQETIEMIVMACLLAGGGLVAMLLWQNGVRWVLPPQRRRATPWEVGEVVFAFVVGMILIPALILRFLFDGGILGWLYGPEFTRQIAQSGPEATKALARAVPLCYLAAVPIQVACVLGFFRLVSGTQPYQLGLTSHRWMRNITLGALAWLVAAPAVLVLNLAVVLIYDHLGLMRDKHQVEEMVQDLQSPWEWTMMALMVVVGAPVLEELLFRGVLQPWAMKGRGNTDLVMAGGLAAVGLSRADQIGAALMPVDANALLLEVQPMLFVALLAIPYLWLRNRPGMLVACAIYAGGVLFAALHASVWPSPIALVPLGMVLGWLAYRTQSLTASMTLHALFNSVAVVGLLITQLAKGKEEMAAPPPASVSSRLPGS